MAGNFEGIKTRNFGIEIEMTGLTRCQAAKAIAKVLGGTAFHEGGSYEDNGMDTSYLRAALERAVYHAQHQEQEEEMHEDPDKEFEETDDFQLSFQ